MRFSDSKPDSFSYSAAISSCAGAPDIRFGTKVHALVVVSGYRSSLPVANSLIDMYGKCLNPNDARKVFDEMNYSNEVTWCSLLFAYANSSHARCGEVEECLHLFKEMCGSPYQPDQWTFSALVNACAESMQLLYGCMVHCFVIKSGWSTAMEVFNSGGAFNQVSWNAIIDAHMKVGDTQKALLAFQQAPEKNIVSWTSMIVGYTRNGNGDLALTTIAIRSDCISVGSPFPRPPPVHKLRKPILTELWCTAPIQRRRRHASTRRSVVGPVHASSRADDSALFEMSGKRAEVEATYDMLLMQRLTQRRAGKVVNSSVRYADVKRVQSQVNGYAGADVPGLILAGSFGASLYFMTKKNVKLGKAMLLGLVAGAVWVQL
ncbi:hypothetical protein TSUD_197210 [Trifolium subterraneum]|uniref:Pentatricopeptide repeat-containing protein n=1 Tax=Trifolium subterraneum TaxID=3900 RepID=A0A2Z6LJU1_TRISU|nr:hypothetical protein TSUD_197210 [Trifolium subterraneum]